MSDTTAAQLTTPPNSSSTTGSTSSSGTAVQTANTGTWPRKITLKVRRSEPSVTTASNESANPSPIRTVKLRLSKDAATSVKPPPPTKPAVVPATLLPPEIIPVRPTTTRRRERYVTHAFQIRMYSGPKESGGRVRKANAIPDDDESDDDGTDLADCGREPAPSPRKKLKLGTPASPQAVTGRGPGVLGSPESGEGGERQNSGSSSQSIKAWRRGRPPSLGRGLHGPYGDVPTTGSSSSRKVAGAAGIPRSPSTSIPSSQSPIADRATVRLRKPSTTQVCGGESHETAITISDSEMSMSP